eukprot:TRINITY_DN65231_c0_g1_i1.p2 TRINITY_DN65231_c0_g1~~TRINITY_DN65231_c0_g1_i1.p2  ORF type:complete len:222 (+),score=52.43 TRINITY_DN65231_c0_g1_i1:96-761(+)
MQPVRIIDRAAVAAAHDAAMAAVGTWAPRQFFGGAMTMDVPGSCTDASDVRDVPDHQEVYVDVVSSLSFVLEVLEPKAGLDGEELLLFHFRELGAANQCSGMSVRSTTSLEDGDLPGLAGSRAYAGLLIGEQQVAKYNERHCNGVTICLAVIRLPRPHNTDILLSVNSPHEIHPESTEAQRALPAGDQPPPEEIIRRMLRTFRIVDYGLFVPMGDAAAAAG